MCVCACVCVCLVTQSCPTLCDSVDCSPPGSSVHGFLQAKILEWVAICYAMLCYAKSLQSCPTLSNPMDCSLPSSSIRGIFQARVLEWGAMSYLRKTPNQIHKIQKLRWDDTYYICFAKVFTTVNRLSWFLFISRYYDVLSLKKLLLQPFDVSLIFFFFEKFCCFSTLERVFQVVLSNDYEREQRKCGKTSFSLVAAA